MRKGQTLISLIVVVAMSIIIISTVLGLVISNSINTSVIQQSGLVRSAAESGMENALLQLLRNPDYEGETIPAGISGYQTVITVTGDDTNKTLESTATSLNYRRKIKVDITYNDNIMQIISWRDIQ